VDPLTTLLGRDPRFLGGAVVGVFGSGGKTALLGYLARELSRHHRRVLVSTSTKVYPFPDLPLVEDPAQLSAAFQDHGALFLGRRIAGGKLSAPEDLPLESLRDEADLLLLECDGARRRSLKVHRPHDPQLPPVCNLGFMVLGASALGAPMDDEHLHRAEHAPEHWGLTPGAALSAANIRRLALSPDGYLGKAGRVALRLFVNQADAHPAAATELAASLAERWAGPVLTGSARQGDFVVASEPAARPCLILCAAGRGHRFGEDKRRFELKGRSLLDWTLGAYAGLPLLRRCLVLGPESRDADLARDALARGWQVVHNPDPDAGLSGSWRAGLETLADDATGALLALADMPAPRPETLRAILAEAADNPARPLRPMHDGEPGHPVYLPRSALPDLAAAKGDLGARGLLPALQPFHLESADPGVILDLDHPDQAAVLEALLPQEPEFHAI
jgi:probable selenium-dependent hydroxylase accessory protein YqeC